MRGVAVILGLALVASACGDDDTGVASDEPTPAAATSVTTTAAPSTSAAPSTTARPPTTTEPRPTLTLQVDGLASLAGDAMYSVWAVSGGEPEWLGAFDGSAEFVVTLGERDPAAIESMFLSVGTGDEPAPSDPHVLAGPFSDGAARLTVADPAALGTDFATAAGDYILATPTDGDGTNERSGVWWTFIPREQSLFLPRLPAGWTYEGWQVIDGVPVTTGTFVEPFGSVDDAAPYSGPEPGPPLVGEDFLFDAPAGLTFPIDLRGSDVAISVEPVPDDGPGPFALIPLRGTVPADAVDHVAYAVENRAADLPSAVALIG